VRRATPHSTTGVAPCELILRNANTSMLPAISRFIPSDLVFKAKENDQKNKERMKREGDKRLHAKEHAFKISDLVIVKQQKSTTRFELEPCTIIHINGNMIVANNEQREICKIVHFFRLMFIRKTR
jgi:hypothetical protein